MTLNPKPERRLVWTQIIISGNNLNCMAICWGMIPFEMNSSLETAQTYIGDSNLVQGHY